MNLSCDLPGNGKGILGVQSDDEVGFNVTSVVESTYSQDGDGDAVPQKFLQSQGQICSTWLMPKVSLLLDPAKK